MTNPSELFSHPSRREMLRFSAGAVAALVSPLGVLAQENPPPKEHAGGLHAGIQHLRHEKPLHREGPA